MRHEIEHEDIGERLEPVCVVTRNVQSHLIRIADVQRKCVIASPVEHDHARSTAQAHEKVVLFPFVVVEPANNTLAGEREVCLERPFYERRCAGEFDEPSALIIEAFQREELNALDSPLLSHG